MHRRSICTFLGRSVETYLSCSRSVTYWVCRQCLQRLVDRNVCTPAWCLMGMCGNNLKPDLKVVYTRTSLFTIWKYHNYQLSVSMWRYITEWRTLNVVPKCGESTLTDVTLLTVIDDNIRLCTGVNDMYMCWTLNKTSFPMSTIDTLYWRLQCEHIYRWPNQLTCNLTLI
jgi:hypothetical protein